MRVFVPPSIPWHRLGAALVASVLFHVSLVVAGFLWPAFEPRVFLKRGEPLIVELPTLAEEPAPLGNPALPLGRPAPPPRPPIVKPRPPVAKPAPKVPPPPRPQQVTIEEPVSPKKAVTREPRAPQERETVPAAPPEGSKPAPVAPKLAKVLPPPGPEAKAVPPEPTPPAKSEPRVAMARPPVEVPPSLDAGPRQDSGGGLIGGRAGIEGEPIPLDTTHPRYTDYFEKVRRQVKAKWLYPREAGQRGIGGQLLIEFAIRKDGWLQFVELKRSSGVWILDTYALNALKLAQPFPPVPDSVAKGPLYIAGIFTYQVADAGLLNRYLR